MDNTPYSWTSFREIRTECQDGILLGCPYNAEKQGIVSRFSPIALNIQERSLGCNPATDFTFRGSSVLEMFMNCPDIGPTKNELKKFILSSLHPWAPNAFYGSGFLRVMEIYLKHYQLYMCDNPRIIRCSPALMPITAMNFCTLRQLFNSALKWVGAADIRPILSSKLEVDERQRLDGDPLPQTVLQTMVSFRPHMIRYMEQQKCRIPPSKLSYEDAAQFLQEVIIKNEKIKPLPDNPMIFSTYTTEHKDQLYEYLRVKYFTLSDVKWLTYRAVNIVTRDNYTRGIYNSHFSDVLTNAKIAAARVAQVKAWTDINALRNARENFEKEIIESNKTGASQSRYSTPKISQPSDKPDKPVGKVIAEAFTVKREIDGSISQTKCLIPVAKYAENTNSSAVPCYNHPPPAPYNGGYREDTINTVRLGMAYTGGSSAPQASTPQASTSEKSDVNK